MEKIISGLLYQSWEEKYVTFQKAIEESLTKELFTKCGKLTGMIDTWWLAIAGSPYYPKAEGGRGQKVYWNPKRGVAEAVQENSQTEVVFSREIPSLKTCNLTGRELMSFSFSLLTF